ncbi:MAG: 50S ribosomal protein L11 methyltransferase [Chlorobi bacterium]|nr:50S ribosomal protein L11 methyltransferase [Chlorobiota bacterium]
MRISDSDKHLQSIRKPETKKMETHRKRTYTALRFPYDEYAEALQAILARYAPTGIELENDSWVCWFDTKDWNEHKQNVIESVQALTGRPEIDVEEVMEQDWNAVWEASIEPVRISEHAIVAPTWVAVQPHAGQHVIVIDPKMSFGTGHHQTTRLCAGFLEKVVSPGCTVLDVGTGTGVLCILAVKLGATRALGLDIDPWAITNARENVARNNLNNAIDIQDNEITNITETFDVVVANINRNEIVRIMNMLVTRTNTDGALIISGILDEDEELIRDLLLREGLHDIESRSEDEWVSLLSWKR